MNTKKPPIVITSIFAPNKVEKEFARKSYGLVIAGDRKTPEPWEHKNCEYLSISQQEAEFPKLAAVTPLNHYVRKNFAYLKAIKDGAQQLFETDDDNFPQTHYDSFLKSESNSIEVVSSSSHFFNVYADFSKKKQLIWPRGYPLKKILDESSKIKRSVKKSNILIQQSLIDDDTDVDAIYRLTVNRLVKFKKNKSLVLDFHTYSPLDSQNTAWSQPAFLLLYLPSTVGSRVCDILRGWVAQRLSWELNARVAFLSPSVYQLRNEHDYLKDFKDEIPLYLEAENIIKILEETSLSGSIEAKLIQIYSALVKNGIVTKDEVSRVKIWVNTLLKL